MASVSLMLYMTEFIDPQSQKISPACLNIIATSATK